MKATHQYSWNVRCFVPQVLNLSYSRFNFKIFTVKSGLSSFSALCSRNTNSDYSFWICTCWVENVVPVLRLGFTTFSWRGDLSVGLCGRAAAAVAASLAPCVKRGKSPSTLNLIGPWINILSSGILCLIRSPFKETHFLFLHVASFVAFHFDLMGGRKRPRMCPSFSNVRSLATDNLLHMRRAAVWGETLALLSHYKEEKLKLFCFCVGSKRMKEES